MTQITVAKVEMQGEGEKQFLLVTAQDGSRYSVWAKGVKGLLAAGNTYEVEVKEKGDWKNITAAKLVEAAPPKDEAQPGLIKPYRGRGETHPLNGEPWHRYLSWAELVAQARLMVQDTAPPGEPYVKYEQRFNRALTLICKGIRKEMGLDLKDELVEAFGEDTPEPASGGPQASQEGQQAASKPSAGAPQAHPEAQRPALEKAQGKIKGYDAFWKAAKALGYDPPAVWPILNIKGMAAWVESGHSLDEALEILRQQKKEDTA